MPVYRGSSKHKNRPTGEQKGTLCPEWSHATPSGGFRTDPDAHNWEATLAAKLFNQASVDPETGRRYATARGVAFEAKPTNDGTWHGYPIPWVEVPPDIKDRWLDQGLVSRRQIKKYESFDKSEIHWALGTDQ